jgi:hypothetical protein
MRRVHSDRQQPRHECTLYRLLESQAARAVGKDQVPRLRLLRSSCPATATGAPPGCRHGSIPVEDLEQAEPSIDRRLGWLSSQPLRPLAARRTRAFSREGIKDVALTSCARRSRDLNCRRGELRLDSRNAVVTDNRKHCQMRLFEAFEISDKLAISRCETRISAIISTVCGTGREESQLH